MSDERERTASGVVITEDLMARIMALPDRKSGTPAHVWTESEDKALLAGWKDKGQGAVAKVIGLSIGSCRDRYKVLMEVNNE